MNQFWIGYFNLDRENGSRTAYHLQPLQAIQITRSGIDGEWRVSGRQLACVRITAVCQEQMFKLGNVAVSCSAKAEASLGWAERLESGL